MELWFYMLAGQIKLKSIYYDNPGLMVIEGLIRQPVSPQEFFIFFIRRLAQKKKKRNLI